LTAALALIASAGIFQRVTGCRRGADLADRLLAEGMMYLAVTARRAACRRLIGPHAFSRIFLGLAAAVWVASKCSDFEVPDVARGEGAPQRRAGGRALWGLSAA